MIEAMAAGATWLTRTFLTSAHVREVDRGGGFCASVYRDPAHRHTVVCLDRSIRGAAHEGRVLRWAMDHSARGGPMGYFEYVLEG